MAIATFNPSIQPSPGTGLTPEVTLNSVPFGDGYTLNSPAGLNHIRNKISLKWDGLTKTQHEELLAFFVAQAGYKPFYYTHPSDGVKRKWTCKTWSSNFGGVFKFSADLEENFSLVT